MVAMQDLWVRVEAVRPDDRARIRVDPHPPEVRRIAERLAERATEKSASVTTPSPKVSRRRYPSSGSTSVTRIATAAMLRKGLARHELGQGLGTLPVVVQLGHVLAGPGPDEPDSSW